MLMTVFVIALASCSGKSKLQSACEEANKQCPVRMDNGIEMTNIAFDGENVVYTVEVSETLYGDNIISQFEEAKDAMAAAMEEAVKSGNDKDVKALLKQCKEAGANLEFKFVGVPSNASFSIELPSDKVDI